MTGEKQTWIKDAMREIVDLICDQKFLFRGDVRQMLTEKAVVIIDGHCPEDRRAGKLVEALRDCFDILDSTVNRSYVPNKADLAELFLKVQAPLAEYEELNK